METTNIEKLLQEHVNQKRLNLQKTINLLEITGAIDQDELMKHSQELANAITANKEFASCITALKKANSDLDDCQRELKITECEFEEQHKTINDLKYQLDKKLTEDANDAMLLETAKGYEWDECDMMDAHRFRELASAYDLDPGQFEDAAKLYCDLGRWDLEDSDADDIHEWYQFHYELADVIDDADSGAVEEWKSAYEKFGDCDIDEYDLETVADLLQHRTASELVEFANFYDEVNEAMHRDDPSPMDGWVTDYTEVKAVINENELLEKKLSECQAKVKELEAKLTKANSVIDGWNNKVENDLCDKVQQFLFASHDAACFCNDKELPYDECFAELAAKCFIAGWDACREKLNK